MLRLIVTLVAIVSICAVAAAHASAAAPARTLPPTAAFPWPMTLERFDNGLSVVVVPFDSPGVVSYYTLVRAGSRNEVEPGRTGYAHFFEHMMFRGTKAWPAERRDSFLTATGSDDNGWTTDDYTCYAITTDAGRLHEIIAMEADRIRNLSYSERAFRTESKAILGEYNKSASDPGFKMFEVLRKTAYTRHTYGHTTMGYIDDIRAMPEGYAYSRLFFERYYAPANVIVIVVGDADLAGVSALVRKHYVGWKKPSTPPAVPAEPTQEAERRERMVWDAPAVPRVSVAWRVPPGTSLDDAAALRLIERIVLGETSPLYRRLVLDKKIVLRLESEVEELVDEGQFTVTAQVPDASDLSSVEAEIAAALEGLTAAALPEDRLEAARSRLRNEFLLSLNSSPRIAGMLARMISLTGTPEIVSAREEAVRTVHPEAIVRTAGAVFRQANRTVVTLVPRTALDAAARPGGSTAEETVGIVMVGVNTIPVVEMRRAEDPTVVVRLAFRAGSADDPPGQAGLTALTARVLAEGATADHSVEEIDALLEPMAGDIRVTVDKEVTSFFGRVPRQDAPRFASLLMERLTRPAFDPRDVERMRREALEDIRTRLRSNDDESLGKETLSSFLYEGHPYGSYTGGAMRPLREFNVDDLKAQRERVFTAGRLTIGLAGGTDDKLRETVTSMARLLPAGVGAGGSAPLPVLAQAPAPAGNRLIIVRKPTASVAISAGFPVELRRGDPDYPALALAASWFGEHRQFNGHLMKRMRQVRGLNYGDYAYTEYFRQEGGSIFPAPGFPRSRQYASIWIRPVEPANGPFALKQAVWELRRFLKEGIPAGEFEETRQYVIAFSRLKEQTLERRLGMALDDRFYGLEGSADRLREAWKGLTREQVGDALRRRWRADGLTLVAVASDPEGLRRALLSGEPATIRYGTTMQPAVLEEDRLIGATDLGLSPDRITILGADDLFEK